MNYNLKELLPLVAKLSEKYTGFESSSITYEKAQQFMEAVLYCIHELELQNPSAPAPATKMPAEQAYERGFRLVLRKVQLALNLYNKMLPAFNCYNSQALSDTFVKGIPEFFKWYDPKFHPQDTILTLNYPVLKIKPDSSGIDRIYEYINCLCLEQNFLGNFPETYLENVLSRHHVPDFDLTENICETVFLDMICHILTGKTLGEQSFSQEDISRIGNIFSASDMKEIKKKLSLATAAFLEKLDSGRDSRNLLSYLTASLNNIIVRLENAADNGFLEHIL